jgi:hypothetical protein
MVLSESWILSFLVRFFYTNTQIIHKDLFLKSTKKLKNKFNIFHKKKIGKVYYTTIQNAHSCLARGLEY